MRPGTLLVLDRWWISRGFLHRFMCRFMTIAGRIPSDRPIPAAPRKKLDRPGLACGVFPPFCIMETSNCPFSGRR
ncbi:hypothetical protein H6G51_13900 [Limnothrix sp. FACHB-708]|uniref:hypothetical protein n=1 Tax=unclassified Limnothrix TaxID=2632864 RepID=UPI0016846180|nr:MULTISPECIES: hypothetical protein [unclassified Limnothrix]MBD2554377.1 hypothetical protein [Limnothrix sp. FACHB-708]MBD2589361.1 hypothetical protein [Limnothrix sp. FACHB-406]